MRQATVNIYKFSELDNSTRDRVINTWRNNDIFGWSDEWRGSLESFEMNMPVHVIHWSVNCSGAGVTFNLSGLDGEYCDDIEQFTGIRLFKWIINNRYDTLYGGERNPRTGNITANTIYGASDGSCPMTGYCGDCDILEPLEKFMLRPVDGPTLEDIMRDCLESWRIAYERDLEHWYSEESITEDIEANEHEFYQDGSLV